MTRPLLWYLVTTAMVAIASCSPRDSDTTLTSGPGSTNGHPLNGEHELPPDKYRVSIEGPKVMRINSARNLRVMVSITGEGYIATDSTHVHEEEIEAHSPDLQANVYGGSAFTIEPQEGKRKKIIGEMVEWVFTVTALEGGEHELYVEIIQFVGESATGGTIKDTFTIIVSVNTASYLLDYLATHLPETIGGGIVLLIGTVFIVIAARMRKKAGLPPDPDSE